MACIRPFPGWLYNREKIGNLELVVAPPYDVITSVQQGQFYQKHPYNIIRLILGKEEPGDTDQNNKYTRAARYLSTWQAENILMKTVKPAIYFYTQDFTLPNGESRRRKGFICLIRLEDFSSKVVLPHEKTLSKPKADRLNLTVACRANFNPIFSLYADRNGAVEHQIDAIAKTSAFLDATDDDGVRHQLWVVEDTAIIDTVEKTMEGKQVLIADGHHRYETALNYRNLMQQQYPQLTGNEAFHYTMMYFSNMHDPGLVILPTHRIAKNINFDVNEFISKIDRYFDVISACATAEPREQARRNTMATLKNEAAHRYLFAMYVKQTDRYYIVRLKNFALLDNLLGQTSSSALRRLDAYIMETLIFQQFLGISCSDTNREDHIAFAHDDEEAVTMVRDGGYDVAFLLNATRIEQVQEIVREGQIMPQKSTYFYPKLLSGLVINQIDPEMVIR